MFLSGLLCAYLGSLENWDASGLPLLHGRVWKSKDVMDLCPGGLCPEGFRTMGFLHGLLVLCRYLIASLCAFGGGPLLPGRHPSMVM